MAHQRTLNFLLVLTLFALFSGCKDRVEVQPQPKPAVQTLENTKLIPYGVENEKPFDESKLIPKSMINYLLTQFTPSIEEQELFYKEYKERLFVPWNMEELKEKRTSLTWGYRKYSKARYVYGDNKKLVRKKWLKAVLKNTNFEALNKRKQKAITIRNSSLRVLPTNKGLYRSFNRAGEGFPFDYNQNSAIYANEPLFVSHYSRDRAWAFVQSSFASGFIDVRDIAIVSDTQAKTVQDKEYAMVTKEGTPIYAKSFLFNAKLATPLAIVDENSTDFKVLATLRDAQGEANFTQSVVSKKFASKMPLNFDKEGVLKIFNELYGEPYGWGGLQGLRDCSALTRDFFAPFGIWLPRNSKSQAKHFSYFSTRGLSNSEKERFIIDYAKPFQTLLHLKGHIMLYLGHKEDKVYVFHNIWGVRTSLYKESGRLIIGKAIISDLHLGKGEMFVEDKSLLINKVKGISIVNVNSK